MLNSPALGGRFLHTCSSHASICFSGGTIMHVSRPSWAVALLAAALLTWGCSDNSTNILDLAGPQARTSYHAARQTSRSSFITYTFLGGKEFPDGN